MGNAHSHGHPHNRLVKPKTNTNSPSLAPEAGPNVDSPVSLSSRYGNLSTYDRQQIKSQPLSPIQTNFPHRESSEDEENGKDSAPAVNRRLSSRSNSLSRFGSRVASRASSITRLSSLPPSKDSLGQSSQPVDLETAISILQEVQKKASPEDIAALQQALHPYVTDPSRPGSVIEPGLSRRTSVVNRSTSSLTRRRSLLAPPGVATRNSPVEGNRRTWNSWKRPQLDPEDEAKWQQREQAARNPPHARISALASAEQGRESPVPRAHTPADDEYSHLGSLQLGSLRIANGEPSPAAHWYTPQPAHRNDDYFSPGSQDNPLVMKTTRGRRHMRSRSALQPPTPPLYRGLRVSDDARKAKTTSRYIPYSKPEYVEESQLWDEPLQFHHGEGELESEPMRRLRVMNKSQDTLATMLDLQPVRSHQSSVPSQHIPVEDYDEGFASNDSSPYRDPAIRILDGTMFGEPADVERPSMEMPMLTIETSSPETYQEENRPSPKKADSGYSSGGSVKTKHRETVRSATTSTVSKSSSFATELHQREEHEFAKDASAGFYTCKQVLRVSTSHVNLRAATAEEHTVRHTVHHYRSHENVKRNLLIDTSLPEDWHIDDLQLSHKTLRTPKTPKSPMSFGSTDSKVSIQKLLQRRKSSHQDLPVVQSCEPTSEASIPGVPANVRKQFVRRLSEAPGMECLTQTYPTKDHVSNEDFEHELEPKLPAHQPVTFPSPSATPEPEVRGRRYDSPVSQRQSSSRGGFRRSLSLFRRKSKAGQEDKHSSPSDEGLALSLGTAAASLGRSPYDIALPATHQKKVLLPTHPHQVGDSMARTVTMDAKTAANLARMRSKDRASVRPGMPPRPKTYYSEREAQSDANVYRRHSFYGHAPPMPTIPSIRDLGAAIRSKEQQPPMPEPTPPAPRSGTRFRARSTGRGPVIIPLIQKYDHNTQPTPAAIKALSARDQQPSPAAKGKAPRSFSSLGGRKKHTKINHPDWG